MVRFWGSKNIGICCVCIVLSLVVKLKILYIHPQTKTFSFRGHGGRVVTLSPPTWEARVRFPARPQVGKLAVACRWSAIYSTEQQMYVLDFSALLTTRRNMTCTVLKATKKNK